MNNSPSKYLFTLLFCSLSILGLLSLVPWSELTGNVVKDFRLLGEFLPQEEEQTVVSQPMVDPQIAEYIKEMEEASNEIASVGTTVLADSDSVASPAVITEAPLVDGIVMIENYAVGQKPFEKFRKALSQAATRTVRIAMIGDSFIEGDIYAGNLRELFQSQYGGRGVGFMAMHSDFPGFRKTVIQSDEGWKMHDIRSMRGSDSIRTLSGDYAKAETRAKTSFRGSGFSERTTGWDRSSFVFLAKDTGEVSLCTDFAEQTFPVGPSGKVSCVSLPGATKKLTITASPGITALGAYLDGNSGIQLDCMSVRGNSGLDCRRMNVGLCRQMAATADYDLIIMEYGINMLSAEQSDYSAYSDGLVKAVRRIREAYPDADILMLGISDRGTKNGTTYTSMATCKAMTEAQREAARRSGVCFWDARAAMGGESSIKDWRNRRLVNADYVHLNHDGGREMARLLYQSIQKALDE